jgi:hypothetical protein
MTPHSKASPKTALPPQGFSDQPFHVGPTLETLRQWFKQHQPAAQWADEIDSSSSSDLAGEEELQYSAGVSLSADQRPRLQLADWQALAEGLVERMSASPQALDALAQAMAQQWQATHQGETSPEKRALEYRTWQRYHVKEANKAASQTPHRLPKLSQTRLVAFRQVDPPS